MTEISIYRMRENGCINLLLFIFWKYFKLENKKLLLMQPVFKDRRKEKKKLSHNSRSLSTTAMNLFLNSITTIG